ncbi:hypothetical protein ABN255_12600 [Providencia rettgeri]|uniref:hypothetical protein n=1 Tax=Providencia TaxID=586 RepID=UPI00164CFAFD|nr:hypothetical protein [Providencia sp. PROV130]MBC5789900.1 hypothetical protein [Providencia sp. JUb39]
MKNYKVVDKTDNLKTPYLKIILCRSELVKSQVTRCKWAWLTLIELLFGMSLLNSIKIISTVQSGYNPKRFSIEKHLSIYIPSSRLTRCFKGSILELLYYKYHMSYLLLKSAEPPYISDEERVIYCSRTRFFVDKDYITGIFELQKKYDFLWLVINVTTTTAAYCVTPENMWIFTSLAIEGIRRFFYAQ